MLFLSPYIGHGTRADPFRPTGADQPGSSAIDIRNDATRLDGGGIPYALLWLPAGSSVAATLVKIADTNGELLANASKQLLGVRTGLNFATDQIIDEAVERVLMRPKLMTWNPLQPVAGVYEAWLGSDTGKVRWVATPAVAMAGGAISDTFTRANETPLASPWVTLTGSTGTVNLSSNALARVTVGDLFQYYNHAAGWNADQSSEWLYLTAITSDDWGPAVRIGSNNFSGYWYSQFGVRAISKCVNGIVTIIENATGSSATGVPYKISVAGSTITYFDNGSANASSPATDTSLATAGNGAGVFWYEPSGALDGWTGTGEIPSGGLASPRNPMSRPFPFKPGGRRS